MKCKPDCSYAVTRFDVHGDEGINKMAKTVIGMVRPNAIGGFDVMPTTIVHMMPSITDLLRYAIVPFPKEPLGVGARWSLTEPDAKRTFTIVAITDATVTIDLDIVYVPDANSSGSSHGALEVSLADPIARGVVNGQGTIDRDPPQQISSTIKYR